MKYGEVGEGSRSFSKDTYPAQDSQSTRRVSVARSSLLSRPMSPSIIASL